MDAVKFVKERVRMCSRNACKECPVNISNSGEGCCCLDLFHNHIEKYVAIVEKWSAEHPVKTKMSELLKIFPNAERLDENVLDICPELVDTNYHNCSNFNRCDKCKEDYWSGEIDDDLSEEINIEIKGREKSSDYI